jgi:hypothetical protein
MMLNRSRNPHSMSLLDISTSALIFRKGVVLHAVLSLTVVGIALDARRDGVAVPALEEWLLVASWAVQPAVLWLAEGTRVRYALSCQGAERQYQDD